VRVDITFKLTHVVYVINHLLFDTDTEYRLLDDVVQTIREHVPVRGLTRIRAELRFHSVVLGRCTTMVVNTQGVKTCENSDFPCGQR